MNKSIRELYGAIRELAPPRIRGEMSKCVFVISSRPSVRRDNVPINLKFPNKERGGLII